MRQDIQNMWIGIGIFLFVLFAVNVFNAWLTDRDSETFERSKKLISWRRRATKQTAFPVR